MQSALFGFGPKALASISLFSKPGTEKYNEKMSHQACSTSRFYYQLFK
jgi:hypothetical protein